MQNIFGRRGLINIGYELKYHIIEVDIYLPIHTFFKVAEHHTTFKNRNKRNVFPHFVQ